jgi:hypothetical protein
MVEKRSVLKNILAGNISEQEARETLQDNSIDESLLTEAELTRLRELVQRYSLTGGVEAFSDDDLCLYLLFCYKVNPNTQERHLLEAVDLPVLTPEQAEELASNRAFRETF